ncbi:MAG: hypothetical protein M3T96_05310 [Acidobacteriota bacterium]|nr:hypothetical protein [Acidobacteriota bacterium]
MNSEELLKYLGLNSDDLRLVNFLINQGITEQPILEAGDYDTYIERPDDGYSLVYTDEAKFKGIMNSPIGIGSLVFTGVFFTLKVMKNMMPLHLIYRRIYLSLITEKQL